jgi:hypothetical protein
MKRYLLAAGMAALLIAPLEAQADQILAFGQTSQTNDVTLTANGGGTQTTLVATDAPINITQIFGGGTPAAFLDINATSVGAATPLGAGFQQHFNGTFSLTSLAGDMGTNYLSGSFQDLAFGVNTVLIVGSSNPPDVITLTSDVIAAGELGLPQGVAFSMSNFTPPVSLDGTTLASGTASVTGTFDATPVPEPISLGIIGIGIAGLGYVRRARRTA